MNTTDIRPIAVVGIPFDEKSSFMQGAADGPGAIREVLNDSSSNFWTESGIEITKNNHFVDYGDIVITDYHSDIENEIAGLLEKHDKLISLGGDHSIAYPIVKAFSQKYDALNILQLDAHTDLYDELDGDRFSHACPFLRILEDNLASKLTQVGIRVVPEKHAEQQKRFKIDVITMRDWVSGKRTKLEGPLYISLDLDVFDPGYAPGVSHHEPGGMSPREVIELILNINVPIVGADIVELNPKRDPVGITAMLGAKLLKELIGKMINS